MRLLNDGLRVVCADVGIRSTFQEQKMRPV